MTGTKTFRKKIRLVRPGDFAPVVSVAGFRQPHPGFCIGPRANKHPDLVYVAKGVMMYEPEGESPQPVREGEVLLIEPGIEHCLRRGTRCRQALVGYIHTEPVSDATWLSGSYRLDPVPLRLIATKNDPDLRGLFRRAHDVFHGYNSLRSEILSTIVREIWLRLSEYWSGVSNSQFSPRMQDMVQFLRANLKLQVGRKELAERFFLTAEHVNYLFKQEVGMSPGAFLQRERMLKAYQLISEEHLSVKVTAGHVGYNDQYHFSRCFKKVMGMPPSMAK